MGLIVCPKHPDCRIVCNGDAGYANFQEAYGPCVKGCRDRQFAEDLTGQFVTGSQWTLYTGLIVNLRAGALAELGENLRKAAPGLADEEAEALARGGRAMEGEYVSTAWQEKRVAEVLAALAAALDAPEQLSAPA